MFINVNILNCLVIFNFLSCIMTFNIDVKYPIFFKSNAKDYFGYSVGLLRNREGEHALITAPRANSSILRDQLNQPGVLFKCKISFVSPSQSCTEVLLDAYGNTVTYNRDPNTSYMDNKNKMFLGVSMDIQQNSDNNRVVVCGHLWKNQYYPKHYLANGVCYVINNELDPSTIKKLVPLVDRNKQSLMPPGIYYYAFAQAGTSAAFSEDGKHLFLGAPGFYDWTGTVLTYSNPRLNKNYSSPIIPKASSVRMLSAESYIGYSITSGRFFSNAETYVAVGGPRDKTTYGQVYIVKAENSELSNFFIHMKKEGTQFGEYFGASVLGVDTNTDGLTDLLVGAPFHSRPSGGDEGKVYVYISNGVGLQEFTELIGKNIPYSRFGTCISNIGDINQDGYNDIAVGAPYENEKGAIYIYLGTSFGLNDQYVQRIQASKVSPTLSGFGISISRGLDIDGNQYPDIIVGSYDSSQAVLFRSRPVIKLAGKLEFTPHQINANVTTCEYKGNNIPCFSIIACLYYTGKHSPQSLSFETEIYIDHSRQKNRPRSFVDLSGKQSSIIRNSVIVSIGKEECLNYEAYIPADTKDVITPIDVSFVYELTKISEDKFCKKCPVVDYIINSNNITKSISFQTGCGADNQCFADLDVHAYIVGNSGNLPLIIGQNSTLVINVDVTNKGEPAYLSELLISLPPEMPNINQDFCTLLSDQQKLETNATLLCELGNPLLKEKKVSAQIKTDVSRIPSNTEALTIIFHATTGSIETNPLNNKFELVISFKTVADIGITGTFEHELIQYDDVEKNPIAVKHTYFIMNHGPSPLNTIDIELKVPTVFKVEDKAIKFVSFTDLQSDSGEILTIPATCKGPVIEQKQFTQGVSKARDGVFNEDDLVVPTGDRHSREINKNTDITVDIDTTELTFRTKKDLTDRAIKKRKNYVIDCETAHCTVIHCVASPFINSRKFARLGITMQLNISALDTVLDPWYRIEYFTSGKIFINNAEAEIQPLSAYPDQTSVRTILVHPGPLPSEEVELWIIYLSIGIGVLLLIIILVVLIKIGFFKRQQKEKMRKMMTNAELKESDPYLLNNDSEINAEDTLSNKCS